MELLKQKQDQQFSLSEQVIILFAVSRGLFKPYEKHDIDRVRTALLSYLRENAPSVMNSIDATGGLTDDDRTDLLRIFGQFTAEGRR
jgi:F0F1-type ATP synthase alpha subunit